MPKVTIYTKDGTEEVEVNERFAEAYTLLEKQEQTEYERKKKQRQKYPQVQMSALGFYPADPDAEYAWDDLLEQIDFTQRMQTRIAELPARQREVVGLFLRGFTEAQIAKTLGISKPAVTKLKKKLQEKFKDLIQ